MFSYDAMGRVSYNAQCTPANCGVPRRFGITYAYDYIGDQTVGSNGNGINWTNSFNQAGRFTQLYTSFGNMDLISGIQYNGFGEPTSSLLGNGLQESWNYDARGRVQSYSAGSKYSYSGLTWAGNGVLQSANDSVNGNWSYGYDDFNRVSASSQTGQAFTYTTTVSAIAGNRTRPQEVGPSHSILLTTI